VLCACAFSGLIPAAPDLTLKGLSTALGICGSCHDRRNDIDEKIPCFTSHVINHNIMRKIFFALASFLILTQAASAQAKGGYDPANERQPIVLGVTDKIKSTELGETRSINVYLPKGYNVNSDTSYPVIYLLDGGVDEDFIHVVGIAQFLNGIVDTMPKCIIIGIGNVDRKRDFTYPTNVEKDKKDYPTTGGSAKFIAFIEKELQPYVQKKYKAGAHKTLIGQSLGGLLATEILFKKPELFTNYLIVSPSLWWDKESLFSKPYSQFKEAKTGSKRVFIAIGSEGLQMENDAKKLQESLSAPDKAIKVTFAQMPEENHLTILHNAVYKGLEVLFAK
jgi:hypothetical protein